ncbi:hypothetical protein RZS08_35365, partial [Arthrospira platensis SPKY1]|nr:hypothetical protein [Arthrospira platensis SPKY1]
DLFATIYWSNHDIHMQLEDLVDEKHITNELIEELFADLKYEDKYFIDPQTQLGNELLRDYIAERLKHKSIPVLD